MIWQKPTSHKECYFCLCNLLDYNSKNKHLTKYSNVASVLAKPILATSLNVLPNPPAMITKCKELIFEDVSICNLYLKMYLMRTIVTCDCDISPQ